MILVMVMGVVHVGCSIRPGLIAPPCFIMAIPEIPLTCGAFMIVLNALMAAPRKVVFLT